MTVKLLFVIDNLEFGGGERVFAQIINGLSPEKYEICLAANPGGELYQSIANRELCHIPLDLSRRAKPSLIFKLTRIIKSRQIDIVHGQGGRAEFYARLAAQFAGGTKYVSTIAMPVEAPCPARPTMCSEPMLDAKIEAPIANHPMSRLARK